MKETVRIIPYQDQYKADFKAINYEWLDKYFEVTALDKKFFDNPTQEIINCGGYIYLACYKQKIIGSVALERIDDKEYILAKMGVNKNYQGKKIGQLLLEKAIEKAKELNLDSLVLYTNHRLVKALNLYNKYGFTFVPVKDAAFERATVKMRLKL